MDEIYVQEPETSGKVVLFTNVCELEIDLWCKETPKASRNFIQLCLEGYYDNTIFHRLIPGFMIQGGDPQGTGDGGQSIYGESFPTETHTRLRFNHRGIVAMANSKIHDNRSQFFITFDSCTYLDKKHTIFGKVVGDTLFNLMNLQHHDTDSEDRPITPITLLSTKVLINPFEDIIPRQVPKKHQEKVLEDKAKPQNTSTLLSFDDEEEVISILPSKIVSSHDVLSNGKFLKEKAIDIDELEKSFFEEKKLDNLKKENLKQKLKGEFPEKESDINPKNQNVFDKSLTSDYLQSSQILKDMKVGRDKRTGRLQIVWEKKQIEPSSPSSDSSKSKSSSSDYKDETARVARKKIKEEYEKLKLEEIRFKKEKEADMKERKIHMKNENKKMLSTYETRRLRFLENRVNRIKEDEVVGRLNKFRKTLNSLEVRDSKDHWMNNSLKFHIDSARAYSHQDKKMILVDKSHEKDDLEIAEKNIRDQAKEKEKLNLSIGNLIAMTEEEPKTLFSMFNSNIH